MYVKGMTIKKQVQVPRRASSIPRTAAEDKRAKADARIMQHEEEEDDDVDDEDDGEEEDGEPARLGAGRVKVCSYYLESCLSNK